MIAQAQRIPSRNVFMGDSVFSRNSPRLGQFDWIPALITGVLQAAPAAAAAYQAKRAADRAKQEKSRQDEAARVQAAADAAAQEQAKAAAMANQGLTPEGIPIPGQKILGVDPIVLAVGGLGILGIGAALFMALKNK